VGGRFLRVCISRVLDRDENALTFLAMDREAAGTAGHQKRGGMTVGGVRRHPHRKGEKADTWRSLKNWSAVTNHTSPRPGSGIWLARKKTIFVVYPKTDERRLRGAARTL